jgi:2-oxoglutarate/2-oxoacid ferredoxin oxidoreductase subunit beta
MEIEDYKSDDEIAWCKGCGNFGILNALKKALAELQIRPRDVLMVSGIGQAAKLPHYIKANCFNGLHGRALPVAAAAKIANHRLNVLVDSGDGDCYGEGGNHFVHNIRRNIDITLIVHNNQIYGLTKGQASPTTDLGFVTKVQTAGVINEPMHGLSVAIALGCGFVARSYSANIAHLTRTIVAGVRHKGFSLIEVLQPCVSFNKKNTYEWYAKRIVNMDDDPSYDSKNQNAAMAKAGEWGEKIPIGILFRSDAKPSYTDKLFPAGRPPLVEDSLADIPLASILQDFR